MGTSTGAPLSGLMQLLFAPQDLPTLLALFFGLRLVLPLGVGWFLERFRYKRALSVPDRRLIQQRLSRLVLALVLVVCAVQAVRDRGDPWTHHSAAAMFAVRGMMWYLLADSLDLLYSLLVYGTPPQWDLWFHHVVLFAFLDMTTPEGMLFNCQAFLGELMALFSGSVFFLSVVDPGQSQLVPWLLSVASVLRKTALLLRFVNLAFVVTLMHTWTPPHDRIYWMFVVGVTVWGALDTYWFLVFFGYAKSRSELPKKK